MGIRPKRTREPDAMIITGKLALALGTVPVAGAILMRVFC